jgi:hypothetical protein
MPSVPQFGCATCVRPAWLILSIALGASSSFSQTNSVQVPSTCACPDGREFSTGSSLFGKKSARVVITGFTRDLVKATQQQGLPSCKDLIVAGQIVHLDVLNGHPFLRRETRKRGTIEDICQTKIQFTESKKSYDFFKDDGSAVTLSDMDAAQAPSENQAANADSSVAEDSRDRGDDDLTGRDLIGMLPSQQQPDDPGSSSFDNDDLKEGAFFIVRRQLKAVPAIDDANTGNPASANPSREFTVWSGSLGQIEKRAGFRGEPLWLVEVLPHSAPLPFSSYLRSLPSAFRKHPPAQKKFILNSSDIVEINHFFDKYSLEWTRFGDDSDDARKRELAGTTVLPEIYNAPQLTLDENLQNAIKSGIGNEIQGAAMRLIFNLKDPQRLAAGGMLVLDDENQSSPAAPHFFHKQCFVGGYQSVKRSGSPTFRVTDADLAIFQPGKSPQIPEDYYAIDLRLQLKSDSGGAIPVVCRFPSAAIDGSLLDNTERILSSAFVIAPAIR